MTDVLAGRRERKKEETKHRIFIAALGLFSERGFEATTIEDIVARADVAKGTFFNYFPRKEALLEYLAEEWIERAEVAASDPAGSSIERLLRLYSEAARAHGAEPELSRMVLRSAMDRYCAPSPDGALRRFEALVIGLIREAQAGGELRSDVDPQVLYGVLGSCFMGSLIWWLGPKDSCPAREYPLGDVVRHLQMVAIDGMRPGAGGAA
jgi:AcrR family transcriptional regulator